VGDLTRADLGLERSDLDRVCCSITHVVHAGASVRFDLPLAEARRVNGLGTHHVLELAARMRRLEHVLHVSTAYVAGELGRPLLEGKATAGRLRNSYERTKLEAEEVVAAAMAHLPITIARPSIVTPRLDGDLQAHFLSLLRLYAEQGWRWVPGSACSLVDLVRVDQVAHALHAIAVGPPPHQRFLHVAAGEGAARLADLGEIARGIWKLRPLRFVSPALVRFFLRTLGFGRRAARARRAAPLAAYLDVRTPIDTSRSAPILATRDVVLPRSAEVFRELAERISAWAEARAPREAAGPS
jgi:long-chain acyl-CoA synthetase